METRIDDALYNAVDVMRASARVAVMVDRNRSGGNEDPSDAAQNRKYHSFFGVFFGPKFHSVGH